MKQLARRSRRKMLSFLPLKTLQALTPRDSLGLFYHVVARQPPAHIRHLYQYRPVDSFEQDLNDMRAHFQPVDLAWLNDFYASRPVSMPKDGRLPLHLSFDDGFVECFDVVRPLLLQYDVPCTFFLATDFIDNQAMYYRNKVSLCIDRVENELPDQVKAHLNTINVELGTHLENKDDFIQWVKSLSDEDLVSRTCDLLDVDIAGYLRDRQPYLSQAQIRTMLSEGFTFGAHSRRHQKLARLNQSEMEREILGSCQVVAAITGQQSVPFSFPNSGDGVDRSFLAGLRSRSAHLGLIFDTKGLKKDSRFIVNRIWVESSWLNPGGQRPLAEIIRRAYLSEYR